jgi:16S rRNA G1207 methylase RsmC
MKKEHLETAFGQYTLARFPMQNNTPLRAWDAADEYLLSHLDEHKLLAQSDKILIINDSFGALSLSLQQYSVQNWSDSFMSHQACLNNFQDNARVNTSRLIPSTEQPQGQFDVVLIKVPKTLALLEDFLIRLKAHIHSDTNIIAAAMLKHLPKSALILFEKILGHSRTSLAKKKARLIFTRYEQTQTHLQSPYPSHYLESSTGLTLQHHANVFSKDKLDIGTRFLLQQFKHLGNAEHIVDLGCGDGILGIMAQKQMPSASLNFIDESYMAIASAQYNYQQVFADKVANFTVSHALQKLQQPADLILCNPPFHQQHSISDFIAWQMFQQSQQQLKKGGELWIVGNRHLNYHSKLKKLFGNCRQIAANRKFTVLAAKKC